MIRCRQHVNEYSEDRTTGVAACGPKPRSKALLSGLCLPVFSDRDCPGYRSDKGAFGYMVYKSKWKGIKCSIESCDRNATTRGYCDKHYCQWHRRARPELYRRGNGTTREESKCRRIMLLKLKQNGHTYQQVSQITGIPLGTVTRAIRQHNLQKPKICSRCPSTRHISGHHVSYHPEVIEWLCGSCHQASHGGQTRCLKTHCKHGHALTDDNIDGMPYMRSNGTTGIARRCRVCIGVRSLARSITHRPTQDTISSSANST